MGALTDTPIPEQVAALARDARGYPIPFVAEWDGEDGPTTRGVREMTLECGDLRWDGPVLWPDEPDGTGTPQLGKVHPTRQLRCHAEGLCGVCGLPLGEPRIYVGGLVDPQTYTEAPIHAECARYSLQVCPGLLGAQLMHGRLGVTEAWSSDVRYGVHVMLPSRIQAYYGPDEFRHFGVLMAVIAFPDGQRWPAEEWLAREVVA